MDLLIDTHTLIWFITDNDKLPNKTKQLIENRRNTCYVSIASYWEIAIKHSLGRLFLESDLEEIFGIIENTGFELLPITTNHILKNASLEFHHQDPFDRVIIAQAFIENLTIVSKDKQFKKYNAPIFW
ncbi:MAG: PIN domain nuclease [Bacteroidetes bacterium]|nr:MAG: PIN domain nuclease [Bacteroidota bacterium]